MWSAGVLKIYAPLVIVLIYLISTLLLYNYGPVDWSSRNQQTVNLFLLSNWFFLAAGYYISIRVGKPSSGHIGTGVITLGFVCNALTIVPTIYMYTGKLPWDASLYTVSQGERYNDYQSYLNAVAAEGGIGRLLQVVFRSALQPFIYGGIIIGIKYWNSISVTKKSFLLLNIALQLIFSAARGTDKEIIDLFVFIVVPFYLFHSLRKKVSFKRYLALFLVAIMVVAVFSERRLSRYGGVVPECFSYAEVCVDYESDVARAITEPAYFSLAILSAYLTQGYNGLSLAMDLDYRFTYGIGHAAILMRMLERLGGVDLFPDTYTYRLGEVGWDSRYLWSSLYTWIANDVSFSLVFFILFLLGLLFGMSVRDAINGGDDYGLIALCFIILLLVYSPANNQLAVSLDMYFSWVFWLSVWLIRKALLK